MAEIAPVDTIDPVGPSRRRQWLIAGGSALCACALAGANLMWWSGDPAFRSVNPNPYFLLICVAAVWHGRLGGALSAVFATVVCVALLTMTRTLVFYDILRSSECRMLGAGFFIAALVLGSLADSVKIRYERLKLVHQETLDRFKDFDCAYQLLEHAKDELEQRVVEITNSFTTIFDEAKNLFGMSRRKMLVELLHLLSKYGHAEQLAAYSVQERGFRLEVELGHTELLPTAVFSDEHPILAHVMATKKMVTIRDALKRGEGELARAGTLVAVPLLDEDGEVAAVITIDALPFMQFNQYTLNVIALVCEWASSVLQQHEKMALLEARQLYDPRLGVYRETYLTERIEEEIRRSQRYHLPLAGFSLHVEPEESQEAVVKLLREELRQVDVLAVCDDGKRFVVILPMTSGEGAQVAVTRIHRKGVERLGMDLDLDVVELAGIEPEEALAALRGVPA